MNITDLNLFDGFPCSPHSFTNLTLDFSLLNYSSGDSNLTVYLNCSPSWASSHLHSIGCPAGSSGSSYNSFFSFHPCPPTVKVWDECSSVVYVPINETATDRSGMNASDAFLGALKQGFGLTWKVGDGWWEKCMDSGGLCRYDENAPSVGVCYCWGVISTDGSCKAKKKEGGKARDWKFKVIDPGTEDTYEEGLEGQEGPAGQGKPVNLPETVGGLVSFLFLFGSLSIYFARHTRLLNSLGFSSKNSITNQNIEAFLEEYGPLTLKRYSYSHVKEITKSFQEKLGQGGCGTVYRGTLSNGHMVAVKILNNSQGNGDDFINEVASIGRTYHVNIVSLLGFCSEGSKRALIYDYMCNGSLEKFLNLDRSKTAADWEKLYQITVGIARGLEYLHSGCKTRIVHFDIKPHNILLDEDFCPKISDFGLAKLCLNKESIISIAGMRGTIGYIAPEVFSRIFGTVSSKSDVYSYGMMVLEMAEGRKNPNVGAENSSEMYFPHWIYEYLEHNRDLLTSTVTAESEETVRKMMLVGLW